MPREQKIKVVALTQPGRDWKALVELDRETISKLTRLGWSETGTPNAGDTYDIGPALARVERLEQRENDARTLANVLSRITSRHVEEEEEEEEEGEC